MKTLLLAALVGTVLAGAATAQIQPQASPAPMAHGGMDRMMRADTDGDGRISRAEAAAEADARFTKRDVNGDGKLCGDENMRSRGRESSSADAMMPPASPARDAGKAYRGDDACVSRDENRVRAMKRFDRLDANHDGFIDRAEMNAAADRMMQMREQRQTGDSLPPAPAKQNPGQ